MKRVYVAGAYNANNVISVLDNMRKGMRASLDILLLGYAPFCPWLDYHFQLMLRENEKLTVDDYYKYSIAWLEVAETVYVIPGYQNSKGTAAEIKRAKELNIPIYFDLMELRLNI
jgi:hypothetical protein